MNLRNMLSGEKTRKLFTKKCVPCDFIPFIWNSRIGQTVLVGSTSVLPKAQRLTAEVYEEHFR